jgi:hypothetical protein
MEKNGLGRLYHAIPYRILVIREKPICLFCTLNFEFKDPGDGSRSLKGILDFHFGWFRRQPEIGIPYYDNMLEWSRCCLLLCAFPETDKTTLHHDNRVMAVLADRSRSQAHNVLSAMCE